MSPRSANLRSEPARRLSRGVHRSPLVAAVAGGRFQVGVQVVERGSSGRVSHRHRSPGFWWQRAYRSWWALPVATSYAGGERPGSRTCALLLSGVHDDGGSYASLSPRRASRFTQWSTITIRDRKSAQRKRYEGFPKFP